MINSKPNKTCGVIKFFFSPLYFMACPFLLGRNFSMSVLRKGGGGERQRGSGLLSMWWGLSSFWRNKKLCISKTWKGRWGIMPLGNNGLDKEIRISVETRTGTIPLRTVPVNMYCSIRFFLGLFCKCARTIGLPRLLFIAPIPQIQFTPALAGNKCILTRGSNNSGTKEWD